ncbi:MAG: TIGR01212 family radical SAM protein [Vampirovibrionales bacterium]|nr:TIGR01212 family radical SAM protein [Vampirovibrionales bacterium]
MPQAQLPYNSYTQHLMQRFGQRVYKITLDAGFNCPNRDGSKGLGGCTFCDETGSSSRAQDKRASLRDQLLGNIQKQQKRYGAQKFIAYFQSYTNTYAPVERLRALYDEALAAHPDIVGLAVSTRPDCVDAEKLALLADYQARGLYVQLEYGMQTIHDRTLTAINRCETHADFLTAIELTEQAGLAYCVHVILGLPGETHAEMMQTAEKLALLRVPGVKMHLLVAMRHTPIAKAYAAGLWQPMARDEYIGTTVDFIERLHPQCVIHRVGGNGHPKHVVAPTWLQTEKNQVLGDIVAEFARRGSCQGSQFKPAPEPDPGDCLNAAHLLPV